MSASPIHPKEQLLDFAYQELPPEEAQQVDRHLQGCADCARELAEIRGVRKVMAPLAAEPAPEAGLESLLAYAQKRAEAARQEPSRRPFGWWWVGLLATAALVVVMMGQLAGPMFSQSPYALEGASQHSAGLEGKGGSPSGALAQATPAEVKAETSPVALAPPPPPPPPAAEASSRFESKDAKGALLAQRERRAEQPEKKKMRPHAPAPMASAGMVAPEQEQPVAARDEVAELQTSAKNAPEAAPSALVAKADAPPPARRAKAASLDSFARGDVQAEGRGAAIGGEAGDVLADKGASVSVEEKPAPASVAQAEPRPRSIAGGASPGGLAAAAPSDDRAADAEAGRQASNQGTLIQLRAALPTLKGKARARTLERICRLELAAKDRPAAEATLHTLEVEFPGTPETTRAKALLAPTSTSGP